MRRLNQASFRQPASLILSALGLLLFFAAAFADDPSNKQQQARLKEIREQIQAITNDIHASEKARNSVQRQLQEIEVRLAKANKALNKLKQQISKKQHALKSLRTRQSSLNTQSLQQRDKLSEQIRAAYITGHQEQLKLLLNQEDPAKLSRIMTYYHYINQARVEVIQMAEKTVSELAIVDKDIQSQSQKLLALQTQMEASRQKIQAEQHQRNRVLISIKESIQSQDQAIARLRTDERRIQRLLQSLNNVLSDIPGTKQNVTAFHTLKGKMDWPTKGSFMNRFGEPRQRGDLVWRGLSIAAKTGSDVKAISNGRVAFADWLQGFGMLVILDHNDGYMSLYGHNQTILKETGDWVESGEIIANVGNTGGQDSSALYFEIRHQGTPVDPASWCRRNKP